MKLTDAARRLLQETVERYERDLEEVAGYLKGRGFTHEAASTFRLGYVNGDHAGDTDYAGRLAIPSMMIRSTSFNDPSWATTSTRISNQRKLIRLK